ARAPVHTPALWAAGPWNRPLRTRAHRVAGGRRPWPATPACRASRSRGSAVACDRGPRSYRYQLLRLAGNLAEPAHLLLGDAGWQVLQFAIRRKVEVERLHRVGNVPGQLDGRVQRLHHGAPPVEASDQETLAGPVLPERRDVGLHQVDPDAGDLQIHQPFEMRAGIAEIAMKDDDSGEPAGHRRDGRRKRFPIGIVDAVIR